MKAICTRSVKHKR
jgi:hypothetical protein